ncbi:MAG: 30S ribosomal protein S12 methylthiotransferase RimO [Prevotella sp.]|nr:30S ribosomal protein S12 methylthiotransferase RimO [Prevotella sp.]
MKKGQVDIVTMGCSKNLVDSELLKKQLEANGFACVHDAPRPQGEIVVVNTCGFIADAKEESINTILELAQAKDEGKIKRLYVMGCLSQRYKSDLEREIPQVDRYFGKFDYMNLLRELGKEEIATCIGKRSITTPSHYAYLKISEGCDRHCAYCAIPVITGRHKSRPKAEILAEVRDLVAMGVKELQVIAQELTYYGLDLDGRHEIADLIREIAEIDGVEWIRLHYAYPMQFPTDLLDVMRENPKVCRYLDIALQHISDPVLKRMRRHVTKAETMQLIEQIRAAVPGIHLRTTLMVGFPGETERDFEQLLEFVRWARFELMGAFAYSEEEDTYSGIHYEDDVPPEVKEQRLSRLMALQQDISAEMQAGKIGQTFKVIIDRKEGDYYVGRSEFSSPEVDPEVLIPASENRLRRGHFYNVRITDSDEFDLYGVVE